MSAAKYKLFLYNFTAAIVLTAAALSCAPLAYAREDDAVIAKKNLCASRDNRYNILVLEHNPPFSWVKQSEEGNIVAYGIGVYILEDLLNSYDIRARRRIKSTETREDLENQTWKKAVDTAVGIQYYPSLRSDIQDNFLHPAYMSNPIVAVFAKGKEKKLRSSSDLVGMNGAYIKSDHIDFLFSKEMYLSSVNSVKEAFEQLLSGKIDYVLMGFYTATMEATKFKIKDKLTISEKPLRRVENFLTLDRSRLCGIYASDFDAIIKAISKDKVKMNNLLYRAYKDYEEQTKLFPALKVEEPAPSIDEEDDF